VVAILATSHTVSMTSMRSVPTSKNSESQLIAHRAMDTWRLFEALMAFLSNSCNLATRSHPQNLGHQCQTQALGKT